MKKVTDLHRNRKRQLEDVMEGKPKFSIAKKKKTSRHKLNAKCLKQHEIKYNTLLPGLFQRRHEPIEKHIIFSDIKLIKRSVLLK